MKRACVGGRLISRDFSVRSLASEKGSLGPPQLFVQDFVSLPLLAFPIGVELPADPVYGWRFGFPICVIPSVLIAAPGRRSIGSRRFTVSLCWMQLLGGGILRCPKSRLWQPGTFSAWIDHFVGNLTTTDIFHLPNSVLILP